MEFADLIHEPRKDERAISPKGQQLFMKRPRNTEPFLDAPFSNGVKVNLISNGSEILQGDCAMMCSLA
jgi:hypothetical protein